MRFIAAVAAAVCSPSLDKMGAERNGENNGEELGCGCSSEARERVEGMTRHGRPCALTREEGGGSAAHNRPKAILRCRN